MFVDKPVSIEASNVGSQYPNGSTIQRRKRVQRSPIWAATEARTISQIANCAKIIATWAVVLTVGNIKRKQAASQDYAATTGNAHQVIYCTIYYMYSVYYVYVYV